MKKFKYCAIVACLLTQVAQANPIQISTSKPSSGAVPVIFEGSTQLSSSIIKNLDRTSKIRTIEGDCVQKQAEIKQSAACVKVNQDSLNISVPDGFGGTFDKTLPIDGQSSLEFSDIVYKKVLNAETSPFLTKIAYVSKSPKTGDYKLAISNYDGSNGQVLLTSPEPILSPAWAPDGKHIAYVSFEKVRASIFVQNIHTNRRASVLDLKGLNAYPSFYNNHELLVSLSSESDYSMIYKYNLLTKQLTKLSGDRSVDIFPKKLNGINGIIKVSLDKNDVPYTYVKIAGEPMRPLANYPVNTPSLAKDNTLLATSRNELLKFNYKGDGDWSKPITIKKERGIESPTISNNGLAIFYISEKKGRFLINSSLNDGRNFSTIKSSRDDLIQVAAN